MSDDKYLLPTPVPPPPTERRPHTVALRLDVAAIIVALVAAAFSGWQGWEAHRARLGAERGAIAAERSANAAEKSLQAAAETFKWEQGPDVSLTEYRASKSRDDRHVDFRITIGNAGKTPVISPRREIVVYFDHVRIAEGAPVQGADQMPIGAHSQMTFTISSDLTAEQTTAVLNGTSMVKVVMTLHFKDVFGEEKSKWWCVGYDPFRTNNWSLCKPE